MSKRYLGYHRKEIVCVASLLLDKQRIFSQHSENGNDLFNFVLRVDKTNVMSNINLQFKLMLGMNMMMGS